MEKIHQLRCNMKKARPVVRDVVMAGLVPAINVFVSGR
jgi:hypothetical protein